MDSSGHISGTPTVAGNYLLSVTVFDSSVPPQTTNFDLGLFVVQPHGRNDSPATATPITNDQVVASLSPYIDPPNGVPFAADHDYYKVVSLGGATVHVATNAVQQGFPDTVLEIVDGNGIRFASCRQPDNTGTNFTSDCLNDDKGASPHNTNSALDFQVPGKTSDTTTFYVHVFEWSGNARPDMVYSLLVTGVNPPLSIPNTTPPSAVHGIPYSNILLPANNVGAVSWSVAGGTLPPGITLSSSGLLSGTGTTDGSYTFTVQVTDSSTPPQVATAQITIRVVEHVRITSSATFPDACVNRSYTFTPQSSNGASPFVWSFDSVNWPALSFNQGTGAFSGVPTVIGTYTGRLGLNDQTGFSDTQAISLTVKNCP